MAPTASTTTKTSSKGYKFGERGSHHIVLGGDGQLGYEGSLVVSPATTTTTRRKQEP